MKVWILTNAYIPETGGLVSYAKNIASAIKEYDEVEIITSNLKKKELPSKETIDGISISRIDYSGVSPFLTMFSPIIYYKRNKKYLKQIAFGKDDIVISRFYSFAAALNAVNKDIKHIFITPLKASTLQKIEAKKVNNILKKIYYYFIVPQIDMLDKKAINKTKWIGVLSKSKQEEIAKEYKIGKDKIKVLYPGIDNKRFKTIEAEEKIKLREKLGLTRDEKIILCVARLQAEKNQEILIECMKKIQDESVRLYFVGGGENREYLQKKIELLNLSDKVKILGEKTNVEDYYRASDVFALLSRYEGFGHVYLEALACGLPCIAAKSNPPETITASSEIVVSEKLGKIVNYNNEDEIIQAIQFCLETSKEYSKYRNQYVIEKFNWKEHYKQIKGVLNNGTEEREG